jgi:hypothetical protein
MVATWWLAARLRAQACRARLAGCRTYIGAQGRIPTGHLQGFAGAPRREPIVTAAEGRHHCRFAFTGFAFICAVN